MADSFDLSKYPMNNRGNSCVITVVSIFTHQGYAEAMKTKSLLDVLNAFSWKVKLKDMKALITDNGNEYKGVVKA